MPEKQLDRDRPIPGTHVYTGAGARGAYALNKFCMSLTGAENREAFKADEDGYMRRFGVPEDQREAVRRRDFKTLIEAGGNIYMVMKIGMVTGDSLYGIGASFRGETLAEFLASRKGAGAR